MNARNFEGMSVLVVDDDDVFRGRLARALSARGLEVRQASTVDEATALVIALALGRESATRTDYANPRFKEIRRIIEQAGGGR